MIYYIGKDKSLPFKRATVQEAEAYLSTLKVMALDTETTKIKKLDKNGREVTSKIYQGGLDPYLSRVIMLQVGDLERQYVIDTRTEDITPLLPLLADPSILKILHNAKFDGKMIYHSFGVWIRNVWDTMIVQNIRENGLRVGYSMDKCAERVLGYKSKKPIVKTLFDEELTDEEEDEWYGNTDVVLMDRTDRKIIDKSIRESFATKGDKPFTTKEIEYGGDDVIIPFKLYLNQQHWLETSEWSPKLAVRLENKYTQVLARMEYNGVNVSPEKWTQLYHKNVKVQQERLQALKVYTENNPKLKQFCTQLDLFNDQPGCSVQWTSPAQVVEVFKALKICPKEKSKSTRKEEWTVSAKALFKSMDQQFRDWFDNNEDQPIVDEKTFRLGYMLFKKSQMCTTTFGLDWLDNIHPITGKVHSSFKQLMSTYRLSSNRPNMQNLPRGKEWRECFISPEGSSWVCTDYSSQESRLLAEISGVETLISFFRDGDATFGDDMHSFTATRMQRVIRKDNSIIITKASDPDLRNKAKNLGFAISYGATKHSLQHSLNCSEEMAEVFIEAYFDGFPGLREDFAQTRQKAVDLGYITLNETTQARYFFPDFKLMKESKEKALALYPDDWQKMSKEKRELMKPKLYLDYPEIPKLWKEHMQLKGDLERKGLNYRIQGLAAAMTKMAGCYIDDACWDNPNRQIILKIHDEIICQTNTEDAEEFSKIISKGMIDAGAWLCKKVPMGAKPDIGDHWIH